MADWRSEAISLDDESPEEAWRQSAIPLDTPPNRSTPNQPAVTALPQEEASPAFGADQLPFMDPSLPAEPAMRGLGATALPRPSADQGMRPIVPFDPAAPGGILSTPIPGSGPLSPQDQWAQRIGAIQEALQQPGLSDEARAELQQTLADLQQGQLQMQQDGQEPSDGITAPAPSNDLVARARDLRAEALAETGGALAPGFDMGAFEDTMNPVEPQPATGPVGTRPNALGRETMPVADDRSAPLSQPFDIDQFRATLADAEGPARSPDQRDEDPFSRESILETARRRSQQFGTAVTDALARLPEQVGVMASAAESHGLEQAGESVDIQRGMIADLEAMLAEPDLDPAARPMIEQRLADLRTGEGELQRREDARPPLTRAEDRPIYGLGARLREGVADVIGTPDQRDTSFTGKVASGAGSMVGMLIPAAVAAIVGGPGAALAVGAGSGSAMTSTQVYQDALASGATEQEALDSAGWGGLLGMTEIVPIARALKVVPPRIRERVGRLIGNRVSEIVQGAGEEFAQEYLSQVGTNTIGILKGWAEQGRSYTDGALEGGLVGAVLGAGMGAIGSLANNAERDRPLSPRLTPSDRASPIPNNVIDDGKAMIEQILSGEPLPQIPSTDEAPDQTKPAQPAAPAFVPAGAVPLDTLYEGGPVSDESAPTVPPAAQPPVSQEQTDGPIPTPAAPVTLPSDPAVSTPEPGQVPASSAPAVPSDENAPTAQPAAQPAGQATSPAVSEPETGNRPPAPNLEVLTNAEIGSIGTNPEVFQYKAGADQSGVTDRLRGVTKWDSNRTGVALVYEYADGRREIADGHQRLDLAKRLAAEGQQIDLPVRVLRETDGYTPADARRIAAEKNIAEGSGTALDAAKIFRDTRMTAKDLNLPRSSQIVRDGDALAKLSPQAFGMVVNEVASQKNGAIVGQIVPEQEKHANILGLLSKLKPSNQTEAESIVRQAMFADVTETQTDMFGAMEVSENLYMERARVMDETLRSLGRKISTFKTLKEQGDMIEAAGNVLAPDANEAQLQGDAALRSALMQMANTKGPISDALTQAAKSVKAGGKVTDAARQFIAAVQAIDSGSSQDGPRTGDVGPRDQPAQEAGAGDPVNDGPSLFDTPSESSDSAGATDVPKAPDATRVPVRPAANQAPETKTPQSSPKPPQSEQQKPAATSAPAVKQPLLNAAEQAELDALFGQMDDLLRTQTNSGLDPQILSIAVRIAEIYVKAGIRRFRDYALAVSQKLKRPVSELSRYLRAAYNDTRDEMEVQGDAIADMDTSRDVVAELARLIQEEKAAPVSAVMPTYMARPVVNAEDIRAWAAEQGFKSTVPADEMHVTLIYSKEPVDQHAEAFRPQADTIMVEGGKRRLRSFGDAVVLTFDDFSIEERNRQLREAGASSDFPTYIPHITITYEAGNINLATIEPYRGPIELGPETVEPIEEDATADLQETKPKAGEEAPPVDLAALRDRISTGFLRAFRDGDTFGTIVDARKAVKGFTGTDYTSDMAKTLEEAIEVAVVQRAREIVAEGKSPDATFKKMVALYAAQPRLAERTSTSIEMQAYSTPAPLGYLASRLAGVSRGVMVYEPTAGNGMLLMEADPENVKANEMQPSRVDGLRRVLGPDAKITTGNAMTNEPGAYQVFIANPPFGKVRDETGQTMVWNMQGVGGETNQIDHAIVMKGLDEMPAEGQAVLIIGGQKYDDQERRREAYTTDQNRRFFKRLYDNYNVTEHFTVDGRLYERQGAGWPVDVIVVSGKGQSKKPYPMRTAPVVYGSWQELGERLDGKDSLDPRRVGERLGNGGNGETDKPAGAGPVSRPAGGSDSGNGGRNPDRGTAGTDRPGGETGQPANPGSEPVGGNNGLGQRDPVLPDGDVSLSVAGQTGVDQSVTEPDADGGILGGLSRAPVSRPVKRENAEVETSFQTQYTPRSQSTFAVGTLVPKNMQQAMTRALDALEQRVGNIDEFVAKELGYSLDAMLGTKDEPGYFSAEQIDALALAIDNVGQGKAFIIGDQTGVGKGRFVAAMLRYAKRQGMIPVFMSKDPGLYADMVRDMRDIGMADAHKTAMMTNTNMRNKDALPLSEDPDDVFSSLTSAKMTAALNTMQKTGKLPDGLDMVFTTYSQMQTVKGSETDRMNALRAIAPNAMFVLDESHEAGGGAPNARAKKNEEGGEIGTRAGFVRELLGKSRGAVFSSATYAKNPNVMSLYAKTDLSLAVDKIDELAQVITDGGVPLQQVMANMLVDAGQYVRREKSYEGIEINPKVLATDQKMANKGAEVLRTLFNLDVDYMQDVRESFIKEKQKEGEGSVTDNAVGSAGMTSTNFTSVMHNIAGQFLLAIKVKGVIAEAVEIAKQGKKPIIALSNTNGAILAEQMTRTGAQIGDKMDVPFNVILERYLERLRRISVKVQEGDKEVVKHIVLTDGDIIAHGGAGALSAYKAAQKFIKTSNMQGLPGSPIDAILDGMRAAGINAGEITGRQFVIEDGTLTKREATTAAKKRTMNAYNRGDLDALVINRSGSTGFSMHATKKRGNDGKPRHMIIAQAEPNIDLFMQMLGRINRTGQSELPGFTVAISDLSVEKRPAAVLMRKMASLNANTTASKKGAVSLDNVTDFLNPYGDMIVARYLMDNPELMHMLDVHLKESDEGLAAKFTGRLVSLPPKQVDEIYADIERNYLQLIDALDRTGTNALEAKVLELDAKTISTTELVPAKDESSPFGRAANIEVVDVKKIGRPYSPEQLVEEVVAVVGSDSKKAAADHVKGQIEALRADMPDVLKDADERIADATEKMAEADTEKKKDQQQDRINRALVEKREAQDKLYRISDMLVKVTPGQLGSVTLDSGSADTSQTFVAMSLGVDTSHAKGRPTAAYRMTVRLAIADAGREISVPLSQMLGDQPDYKWTPAPKEQQAAMLAAFEQGQTESREQRQIITGNIPAGFAKMGGRGQIVLYTGQDGGLKQGIMLGAKFDAAAALRNRPAAFTDPDHILEFVKGKPGSRMVESSDGVMRIGANSDGEISFFITNKGSKAYTLLKAVRDIVGDWTQRGGAKGYTKAMGRAKARDVIRAYQENLGTEFQTDIDKDEARKITGEVLPDIPSTDGQKDMLQGSRAGMARPSGPLAMRPGGMGVRTTPIAKVKAKAIAKDLQRIAAKSGLPTIPIEVVEEAFLMSDGETVPLGGAFFRGAITIAMQANGQPVDMASVMNHELVHMLRNRDLWGREYGLFRSAEWQELERAARKNGALLELTRRDYADSGDRLQVEETIARMYQDWLKGNYEPKGFVKSAFERIKAWLNALRDALTGNGFQTADQIFTAMERGDIGRRSRYAGPMAEFSGEAQLSRAMKRDAAIASMQAGEELETGVTPLVPPKRRQDTFLRTAMTQPLDAAFRVPFMMAGGLDQAGRWKYGKAAEAKLRDFIVNKDAGFMAPLVERVRAGMVDRYGLPDDYVERERRRGVDAALIASEGKEHIEAMMKRDMGPEESRVLQAVLTGEAVADADMAKLSEPIRKAIDDMGAEAVELGLISREAYERNRGKYLHRVYAKHETDDTTIEKWNRAFAGNRRRKIIGDQFKGRGIFEEVDAERIFRDNPEFLEAKRGRPQPGDKVIILDLRKGANVPGLTGMDAPKGRLQRRVYWPADVKIPDRLNNYENRGTFEVRGTQNGKVVLWRDFTKPERLKMGEIMDARYTVAKTYALMSEDLATGRFFRDIALNEEWSRKAPPEGAKIDEDPQSRAWGKRMWADPSLEWVKVPESKIAKSDTFRYGALAGRYVRADIWRDMEELRAMQTPNFWQKMLTQWKLNKTARNPVVHMNNVMSNMMLMDMADIRVPDLIRGIMAYAHGDASYQEAALAGAFGTDQVSAELRENILKPMLAELKKEMQGGKGGFEGEVGRIGRVFDTLVKSVKWADERMLNAYQIEDQVFRMATYIRRREQGLTVEEAATEARDQFLNYDIRAPWINAARRSLLPFIGYTYRAVPKIAQTVAERPWKIAKYIAVMQAMNMMAYAVAPSDDDEDEERRSMQEREQGYTWTGSPRMVRMPWLDDSGNPVFLDVRRWIPAGDVFDTNGGDIPAWLQVGGPLVIGMELYLNRQAFTGDDIVNPLIDTWGERMKKRADFLYRSMMPSAPWVWNSWYYDQIARAVGQRERNSLTGETYSPLEAALSSFGIKMKGKDVEAGFAVWQLQFDRIERELGFAASQARRDFQLGRTDQEQYDRAIESIVRKRQALQDRAATVFGN